MSTLLVTGGGGFVMSHLARQWVDAAPENRAVVLDAAPLDGDAAAFLASGRIRVLQGSVLDPVAWEAVPEPAAITHIVHGAAVTSIQREAEAKGIAGVVPALGVNILGVAEALGFAQRCPALARFVYVSSGAVYATHARQAPGQPLPEDGSVAPEGWYSLSKLAGEFVAEAGAQAGVPAVSVRLSGVFGPLDRTTGARAVDCLPKRLVHAAREGRKLRLAGLAGGGDFIHAGDIAAGMRALMGCAELRHPVYNIAHGRFTTLAALARMVPGLDWEETAPDEADIAADPALTAGRWGAYDISRIVAETGWRPRPLEAAIADYAGWLRDHRW